MLLHTIVPFEAIFGGQEQPGDLSPQAAQADNTALSGRERRVPGGLLELDEQGRISRLVSTDPRMYLEPRYAPGQPVPGDMGKRSN